MNTIEQMQFTTIAGTKIIPENIDKINNELDNRGYPFSLLLSSSGKISKEECDILCAYESLCFANYIRDIADKLYTEQIDKDAFYKRHTKYMNLDNNFGEIKEKVKNIKIEL